MTRCLKYLLASTSRLIAVVLRNSGKSIPKWISLVVAGLMFGGILIAGRFGLVSAVGASVIVLVLGGCLIHRSGRKWAEDIESDRLLRSDEKLQNKDCRTIVTISCFALLLGLCAVFAGADILFPNQQVEEANRATKPSEVNPSQGGNKPTEASDRTMGSGNESRLEIRPPSRASYLALLTALASVAVGGAFGFLLGHPRRIAEEDTTKEGRTGSSWLLRTGLDDIVDWLVKGITTVLLVESRKLLQVMYPVTVEIGKGLAGGVGSSAGQTFATCVIVYFTLFGVGASCLVTRTYLTGALGRADRSTLKDFVFGKANLHWGEILTLVNVNRSLGRDSQSGTQSEVDEIARKLAALSLSDLRTPQEIALWARAKAMQGQFDDAVIGYEKAVLQCDCDPSLYLDFAVTLGRNGDHPKSLQRLEQARDLISKATPLIVVKNIYKSLTYSLLFNPDSHERVIQLCEEYLAIPNAPFSGGISVNRICAYAARFQSLAVSHGMLPAEGEAWQDLGTWPEQMKDAYHTVLESVISLLKKDPGWRYRLEVLMIKGHKDKGPGDNDLEVFETFPEFRKALGLAD